MTSASSFAAIAWILMWAAGLTVSTGASPLTTDHPTRWRMINVSPNEQQADCHLLEFPDGRKVVIDVADAADAPGTACAALKRLNVTSVDLVVLSHFHLDHYGRLLDLIDSGVKIARVAVNIPDEVSAVREVGWGCDLGHVRSTLAKVHAAGIEVFTPKPGDCLLDATSDGTRSSLVVLAIYHGLDSPIGPTDVNDTSIILRLNCGSSSALFTGDLNSPLGEWLAKSSLDLHADILKAPHHGTEGCAPDSFFDRVHASAVLVPSPKKLWLSGRSMRIRNYFSSRGVPAYVNGINGDVLVTFHNNGYSIETER